MTAANTHATRPPTIKRLRWTATHEGNIARRWIESAGQPDLPIGWIELAPNAAVRHARNAIGAALQIIERTSEEPTR